MQSLVSSANPVLGVGPTASSSRPRRSRIAPTESNTSPAPTNGSNSARSSRSRLSRSLSGNLASPEKSVAPEGVPLPRRTSPSGSANLSSSQPTSGKLTRVIRIPPAHRRNGKTAKVEETTSSPKDDDDEDPLIGYSEEGSDEEPEVIPAKKKRKFQTYDAGRTLSEDVAPIDHDFMMDAKSETTTPRIKLITVPRPRSRSKSKSPPVQTVNGDVDLTPTPAVSDAPTPSQITAEDEREAEAAIIPDGEDITKIPDLPRRAPRKKRKWLKKGEVDPDDPVAVARQKEKHAIIDEAIANLDAQEAAVRSEEHPQLVLMWKELERRRYLQLTRLQERLIVQKQDLMKMYDHDEAQAWENWDEIKEELVDELSSEEWRKISQLYAERIALKRQPGSMPSLREGKGSGGWQVSNKKTLSNGKLSTVAVLNSLGHMSERRNLPSRPSQISDSELKSDLLALGIKGEITGRPQDVAPPKQRLSKAAEEKKAESRRRTRAFSPPPPEARPSMTSERYKTIADAFNESAGPFSPLPLDHMGQPNTTEKPYLGEPCPNPKLPVDVKAENDKTPSDKAKPTLSRVASNLAAPKA